MKIFRNVALILLIVLALFIIVIGVYFNINLSPMDKDSDKLIMVVIPSGTSTKGIGEILEEEGLIRNAHFFSIYAKIYKINDLKASTYELSPSMNLEEIIDVLQKGNSYNPDAISITFQEGINMRKVASIIADKTNNSEEDVFNKLSDQDYLDRVIASYWFLSEDIKNSNIYYSLEGYLYPDTYFLESKDTSVEDIFKLMLDQTDKVLTPLRSKFEEENITVHELLTLASIVEIEGVTTEDRQNIASVFYNRLNSNMSLGSDVTTYYAFKIEMSERDLRTDEINTYNPYNTRGPQMEGKLPVGPVSNPSIDSIEAVLEHKDTDYLYFVADKNRKVYFTKTYAEHLAKIQELKDEGAWLEW